MAESLGSIILYNQGNQNFGIKAAEFQQAYWDELLDLVGDSDHMVKIKALLSATKLVIYEDQSFILQK